MTEHGEAIDRLAAKVSDHSSVLQALQVENKHISKGIDRLIIVSEKQAELGHQLERNNESIKRAFAEMGQHKSDLTTAIDNLAESFKTDRGATAEIAKQVTGYEAALRTLKYIGASVLTLVGIIVTMYAASVTKDIETRAAAARDKHAQQDSERTAMGIKLDALTMQVQEVRLDRQRDQEAKQP